MWWPRGPETANSKSSPLPTPTSGNPAVCRKDFLTRDIEAHDSNGPTQRTLGSSA